MLQVFTDICFPDLAGRLTELAKVSWRVGEGQRQEPSAVVRRTELEGSLGSDIPTPDR